MKRAFIVHGWDGNPKEGWFPWLKSELEKNGFEVEVPQMPDAGEPRIHNWVPALVKAVGVADSDTYLIGHSMGCQTIVRYLETLPEGVKVGGAVFVAGFLKRLTNLDSDEEKEIADSWFNAPVDLHKVKSHLPKSVAVFSETDMFVPLDNREEFEKDLGSKIIIEDGKGNKGHFSGSDGVLGLPVVLESILEMTK